MRHTSSTGKTVLVEARPRSGAERVLDELDDQTFRATAIEGLGPAAAQGQHLGERLIAGGDHASARLGGVAHLEADVSETVIALADGDRLAFRRQPLEELDVVAGKLQHGPAAG